MAEIEGWAWADIYVALRRCHLSGRVLASTTQSPRGDMVQLIALHLIPVRHEVKPTHTDGGDLRFRSQPPQRPHQGVLLAGQSQLVLRPSSAVIDQDGFKILVLVWGQPEMDRADFTTVLPTSEPTRELFRDAGFGEREGRFLCPWVAILGDDRELRPPDPHQPVSGDAQVAEGPPHAEQVEDRPTAISARSIGSSTVAHHPGEVWEAPELRASTSSVLLSSRLNGERT